MRLKKTFTFTDKNQIWRLLISNSDYLIIETRNTGKKEVYFHCIDLQKGKTIFKDYQFVEKFWIGIEAVSDNKILLHKFAKPNMPEHKGIIAFDIENQKILWNNDDLTFLSIVKNKIYAFRKKFDGQDIFLLDADNGKIIEEFGNNSGIMNRIMEDVRSEEDFSDYKYPEKFNTIDNPLIESLIENEVKDKNIASLVEYLVYDDFLFFNYYVKLPTNLLDNNFVVYNIVKKKKVISEVINKSLNSFSPDSFFLYKNFLLLLENKMKLTVHKIS